MDKVFLYCERGTDPAFWAEPLNALSNAAFLAAALAGLMEWNRWRHDLRGASLGGGAELALVVLVAAVGTGSFLFHTLASPWAMLADVVPITVLMLAYVGYALRRFVGLGWLATAVAMVAVVGALAGAEQITCDGGRCLNGSVGYLPALAALVVIGGWLAWRRHPAARPILAGAVVLAASLTFRTLDRAVCAATEVAGHGSLGTHFLWHLLNGLLLYLLLRAAVRYGMGCRPAADHGTQPG